jgi:antitoxin (DNA-binding transcriptional repressor) of toxin-antitoxin stability system
MVTMEREMLKTQTQLVTATEFKAKCLAMLDQMEMRGETITITRWGKPVAVLGPPERDAWLSPKNSLAGQAEIVGDIVNHDTAELWDAVGKE